MKRNENFCCKHSVLLLQRHSVSIDDRAQDLQKLCQTIVLFFLICDKQYQVLNFLPDVWPQRHEPSIDSMHDCFEVIPFSWVFWVKKLEVLLQELGADRPCHNLARDIWRHHKLQEKFIHQLEMRPCFLEMGLIFIRINLLLLFVVYMAKLEI